MSIRREMGGLLWRRVYEARANAESHVPPMLADTLEALLQQAGVPEPEPEDVAEKVARL
jgi:hypothetical protein